MDAKLVFAGTDVCFVDELGDQHPLTSAHIDRSKLVKDMADTLHGDGCAVLPVSGDAMKAWMLHVGAGKRSAANCDRLAMLFKVPAHKLFPI